jgi:O-antigen/teichoic acid export membrane protein
VIRKFLSSDFFRASAWMMIATLVGGGCMMLFQIVAGKMPSEFLLLVALLDIQAQIAIPTLGIQAVLAHRTAKATATSTSNPVGSAARWLLGVIFVIWCVAALAFFVFRHHFLSAFEISNPLAVVFTLLAALLGMTRPVMAGLLQGKQDFTWFGLATLFNGIGRVIAVALIVLGFGGLATGAMAAVCVGVALEFSVMTARTRDLWGAPATPRFDWKPLAKQILPISLMLGVPTLMFTLDSVVVKNIFGSADDYGHARIIGRTLVFATAPMIYVMFPRIVRSAARAETSNVLMQTVGATIVVGASGATFLTLFPELPLRFLWGSATLGAAPLVPWFAWCMLPLAVANVLINNLLARERYAALPWLIAVAVGYGLTLWFRHDSLLSVIQALGAFSVLLVIVSVTFSLLKPQVTPMPALK